MESSLEDGLIVVEGDSLLSPLGLSPEETFRAVRAGKSALRRYEGLWGIPEPFIASLFEAGTIDRACAQRWSPEQTAACSEFERMAILAASLALEKAGIDPASERVLFFLSTTKGNVARLEAENRLCDEVLPGCSARRIAAFFHNTNQPIVVSNACTSGLCAQISAMRALRSGRCDHAVVIGAEQQSKFIVSGFQSFKALAAEPCRPFDRNRSGLNPGEAAAALVYTRRRRAEVDPEAWVACRGAIRNDANHISGPSRTGEGCWRALRTVMQGEDPGQLAFISAHGTATPYNDEMEAIAIDRAGLAEVPVGGWKGYFGHTMGAAGVLESILSMRAAEAGELPGTRGYAECGVSRPLRVSAAATPLTRGCFLKMLSGFGGCNAAMLFKQAKELC